MPNNDDLDECIDECATENGCRAVNWHRDTKDCQLLSRNDLGSSQDPTVDSAFETPATCTSGSRTQATENGGTGSVFDVTCGKYYTAPDTSVIRTESNAATLDTCIHFCDVESGCVGVDYYRNTLQCKLLSDNTQGNDATADVDSAARTCNQGTGTYTASNGQSFDATCNSAYSGQPGDSNYITYESNVSSLAACIQVCEDIGTCGAVIYYAEDGTNANIEGTRSMDCNLLTSAAGNGVSTAGVYSAKKSPAPQD